LYITSTGIIYGEIGIYNNYPVKILMTDANGIKCSKIYDLNTNIENQSIISSLPVELFPNPAKDKIVFRVNDMIYDKASIKVFDCYGRTINTYKNVSLDDFILDIADYRSGRYIVGIVSGNNYYSSGFIKY